MLLFLRTRLGSFRPAVAGLTHLLRTQPNAWIHAGISVIAMVLGLWLHIDIVSWALIAVTIGFVWTAEAFNTAIEAIVDLASPNHHHLAQAAKDVSAAAVVIAAMAAVVVGFFVLGPPLWLRLCGN